MTTQPNWLHLYYMVLSPLRSSENGLAGNSCGGILTNLFPSSVLGCMHRTGLVSLTKSMQFLSFSIRSMQRYELSFMCNMLQSAEAFSLAGLNAFALKARCKVFESFNDLQCSHGVYAITVATSVTKQSANFGGGSGCFVRPMKPGEMRIIQRHAQFVHHCSTHHQAYVTYSAIVAETFMATTCVLPCNACH